MVMTDENACVLLSLQNDVESAKRRVIADTTA